MIQRTENGPCTPDTPVNRINSTECFREDGIRVDELPTHVNILGSLACEDPRQYRLGLNTDNVGTRQGLP